jgi:DMSO reductase anchor subunit
MHPAPSVIIFTVLSGLGFGLMAALAALAPPAPGPWAALPWGAGYALATAGLVSSTFHLGQPRRAWRAFTQWRTSWLSREAWAAVAALAALAPPALSDVLALGLPGAARLPGAAFAALTVVATAMIYAQIRAVPRWHSPMVPAVFLAFFAAGGLMLAGLRGPAVVALAVLGALLVAYWREGDGAFARAGETLASATGLTGRGALRVFEWPHTGDNYLLREMIHVVGRRHARRLRGITLVAGVALPAGALLVIPGAAGVALAALSHALGALAQRWLFFAEAEHVVGLYYGQR